MHTSNVKLQIQNVLDTKSEIYSEPFQNPLLTVGPHAATWIVIALSSP
jgi:hypothetical protein